MLTRLTAPPVGPARTAWSQEPQHLDALQEEGVSRSEGGPGRRNTSPVVYSASAQTDVFSPPSATLEADARRLAQRVLSVSSFAVFHQLLGHDGDGLRNVAQLLLAFADAAFGGEVFLLLSGLSCSAAARCARRAAQLVPLV